MLKLAIRKHFMRTKPYERDLKFLLRIVKNAQNYILKNMKKMVIKDKGDNDVVTNLDYGVEKYFTEEIKNNYPTFDIVSEEFNPKAILTDNCFIFDPIDGTSAFTHGLPTWGIQIAMIKNKKFVASVVAVPCLKEIYWAVKGHGAYLNGKRIHVSDEDSRKCYYSLIGRKDKFKVLETLHKENPFNKDFASISYTMGLIARGTLGGLAFYRNYIWDIAPGTMICREAGAKIYDIDGKGIIVANTDELLELLKKHSLPALNLNNKS